MSFLRNSGGYTEARPEAEDLMRHIFKWQSDVPGRSDTFTTSLKKWRKKTQEGSLPFFRACNRHHISNNDSCHILLNEWVLVLLKLRPLEERGIPFLEEEIVNSTYFKRSVTKNLGYSNPLELLLT